MSFWIQKTAPCTKIYINNEIMMFKIDHKEDLKIFPKNHKAKCTYTFLRGVGTGVLFEAAKFSSSSSVSLPNGFIEIALLNIQTALKIDTSTNYI